MTFTLSEREQYLRELLDQLHAECDLATSFMDGTRGVNLRLRIYALEETMIKAGHVPHRLLPR